jgi:glycosyltransferase involved in cell wall biosynthesis
MGSPPDICIMGYDLRASGVVRNALRIAGASHAAGLATALWVAYDSGKLRDDVPDGVRLIHAGLGEKPVSRTVGLAKALAPLSRFLHDTRPAIALSSGNHLHVAAGIAHRIGGRLPGVALWARASNAPLRHALGGALDLEIPRLAVPIVNAVNRLQYRPFDRVIAVSAELGKTLRDEIGVAPERLAVIVNGVDADAIAEQSNQPLDQPWFAPGEMPVILSAGRLSRQKNFADLIQAFALVRRSRACRLVILGEGLAARRHALLGLANDLGVSGSLLLAGFDANPYRWMARSAVFAITSRWEGASNVALEALACGTPVVGYACPTGIREVVQPVDRDAIVAVGDVPALASAILRRLDRPRNADEQRRRAGEFSLSATLSAYVAEFVGALDERAGARGPRTRLAVPPST